MRLFLLPLPLLLVALGICGCSSSALVGSCNNGIRDGAETDVDCGGVCKACAASQRCQVSGDCAGGACVANVCAAANACGDRVKDGRETDVDCGGGSCAACALGSHCAVSADCAGGACSGNVCAAASSCSDLTKDGNETDVDCGGSCTPCAVGRACAVDGDCASAACGSDGHCVQPLALPVPAVGVYAISDGTVMPLVQAGEQAGFAVSALGDGSFRLVWTGDGAVSGQYHEFDGSLYTDGSIAATPGCSDQSCGFFSGDYLSLSYSAGGGSRVDFSAFDPATLEGFEVSLSGGANDGQTVYLELYVDGEPVPGAIFFVGAATGQASSPLTIPFGLTAQ